MKKIYSNMSETKMKTWKDMREWRKERKAKKKDLSYVVPSVTPNISFLSQNRQDLTITWVGHATFFIQIGGLNIITDPVWANWMGTEKRLAAPGMDIEELPQIDIVLISHGHYDHLHFGSIRKLKGEPLICVPDGLKPLFNRKGFTNVQEYQWWETSEVKGITLSFVPAQHWTRRTLFDTNTSHWGGWIMTRDLQSVYFVGDSGYFNGFSQIGERYSLDYVLMPIGAYEPEWFMKDQHVSPEEAVQAFLDTKGKVMIPMHYGSYRLADDTPKEALDRLLAEWEKRELAQGRLKVLKQGESIVREIDEVGVTGNE